MGNRFSATDMATILAFEAPLAIRKSLIRPCGGLLGAALVADLMDREPPADDDGYFYWPETLLPELSEYERRVAKQQLRRSGYLLEKRAHRLAMYKLDVDRIWADAAELLRQRCADSATSIEAAS